MSYELFLTTRQNTKIRNAFANNTSTDIKFSKARLPEIIYLGRFLGKMLGNLGKKALLDLTVCLAKDVLPKLATKATSSILSKFEKNKNKWDRSRKSSKRIHFVHFK